MFRDKIGLLRALLATTVLLTACGGNGGGDSDGNGGRGGGGGGTPQGTFTATGDMIRTRTGHTATLLSNGKVLIAGPQLITGSAQAGNLTYHPYTEVYSPTTGTSVAIDDVKNQEFYGFTGAARHVATTLFSGRVLLSSGGTPAQCQAIGDVMHLIGVIYDPAADTYTGTGPLNTASRSRHTATLLPNGKVLLAGGSVTNQACAQEPSVATADLYDPATDTGAATGSMITDRINHTATLLQNGKVLIAGGNNSVGTLAVAELYDPATGMFTATGSMTSPRANATANLLGNGKVLITGGVANVQTGPYLASAELFDPATGVFSATGSMSAPRFQHTATLLSNGMVLVGGGRSDAGGVFTALASAEIYDPATGTFTATASMAAARSEHTATLLTDGRVLITGGTAPPPTFNTLASVEVFELN